MAFDDLIVSTITSITSYGYYLVLLFCLLQVILLLWFQEGNIKFMLQNFFYLKTSVTHSDDLDLTKGWSFFLKSYKLLSILKYISFAIWIIVVIMGNFIIGS